jgi:hypothetical protein
MEIWRNGIYRYLESEEATETEDTNKINHLLEHFHLSKAGYTSSKLQTLLHGDFFYRFIVVNERVYLFPSYESSSKSLEARYFAEFFYLMLFKKNVHKVTTELIKRKIKDLRKINDEKKIQDILLFIDKDKRFKVHSKDALGTNYVLNPSAPVTNHRKTVKQSTINKVAVNNNSTSLPPLPPFPTEIPSLATVNSVSPEAQEMNESVVYRPKSFAEIVGKKEAIKQDAIKKEAIEVPSIIPSQSVVNINHILEEIFSYLENLPKYQHDDGTELTELILHLYPAPGMEEDAPIATKRISLSAEVIDELYKSLKEDSLHRFILIRSSIFGFFWDGKGSKECSFCRAYVYYYLRNNTKETRQKINFHNIPYMLKGYFPSMQLNSLEDIIKRGLFADNRFHKIQVSDSCQTIELKRAVLKEISDEREILMKMETLKSGSLVSEKFRLRKLSRSFDSTNDDSSVGLESYSSGQAAGDSSRSSINNDISRCLSLESGLPPGLTSITSSFSAPTTRYLLSFILLSFFTISFFLVIWSINRRISQHISGLRFWMLFMLI